MKVTVEAEVVGGNKHDVEKGIWAYNVQVTRQKDKVPQATGQLTIFAQKGGINLGDIVEMTVELKPKTV